jgi:predicted metal-binding membrane protein
MSVASLARERRAVSTLAAVTLAASAAAWVGFAVWMGGMPGVGADLAAATFLGSWALMMAAMMLPSMTPVVALYDRMRAGHDLQRVATAAFVAGYLATWTAVGLGAYGLVRAADALAGDALGWQDAGRPIAGAVILVAAAYQLSPLKERCLRHCRSPLGFLLSHWRGGYAGAAKMGAIHGAWCVGCCWALMATLFAVGLMSLGWMAFVAVLIAIERLVPWNAATVRRVIAGALAALGLALRDVPNAVPGADRPAGGGMDGMTMMER